MLRKWRTCAALLEKNTATLGGGQQQQHLTMTKTFIQIYLIIVIIIQFAAETSIHFLMVMFSLILRGMDQLPL